MWNMALDLRDIHLTMYESACREVRDESLQLFRRRWWKLWVSANTDLHGYSAMYIGSDAELLCFDVFLEVLYIYSIECLI